MHRTPVVPGPATIPSAVDIQRLVSRLTIQRTAAGGLVVEAPPETAATLAARSPGWRSCSRPPQRRRWREEIRVDGDERYRTRLEVKRCRVAANRPTGRIRVVLPRAVRYAQGLHAWGRVSTMVLTWYYST